MANEIQWFDPESQLPEDGQECLIMPHDRGGLVTIGVFGPIRFDGKSKCWLDIFRTPEAGTIIAVADVGCWTLWEPIAPPEGLPTEYKDK